MNIQTIKSTIKKTGKTLLVTGLLFTASSLLADDAKACGTYVVQKGDTLTKIVKMIPSEYGVSLSLLKEANGLTSDSIKPGDVLSVPEDSIHQELHEILTAQEKVQTATHKVKKGENLTVISNKYGMTLKELKSLNKKTTDTISVGDKLKVAKIIQVTGYISGLADSHTVEIKNGKKYVSLQITDKDAKVFGKKVGKKVSLTYSQKFTLLSYKFVK